MSVQNKAKEKERELELKHLRRELEEKLIDQLPQELLETKEFKDAKFQERDIQTDEEAKRIIEAIIFSSAKPMLLNELKKVIKGYSASKIEGLIRELQSEYEKEGRSFRLSEVAGGFEISTESKYAPWICRLELQKRAKQATRSALETLAILAYKQPLTRAEIEDLRGVDVAGVVSTLLERNLIKVVGRKEVPGRPFLYGTTDKFLEHFGLKSLTDLPDISEIKTMIEKSIREEDLMPLPASTGTVVSREPEVSQPEETPAHSSEANPETSQ